MKERINVTGYAQMITEALPKGILLNTKDTKFNSMVISHSDNKNILHLPDGKTLHGNAPCKRRFIVCRKCLFYGTCGIFNYFSWFIKSRHFVGKWCSKWCTG